MVTESRLARRRRERAARRQVVRDAGGIGLAVGAYGLSFGALTTASGFEPRRNAGAVAVHVQRSVPVRLRRCGRGGRIAAVGVAGRGHPRRAQPVLRRAAETAAAAAVAGARPHRPLRQRRERQHGVRHPENPRHAFWSTGLAVFLFWNIGTFAGAVVGSVLPDPQQLGLDAASSAAFLALLAPRLRERFGVHVFVLAVLIAVGAATMLPSGFPVLLAASAALLGALATPKPDSPPSVLAQPRPPTAAAARVPKPAPPPYPMPYQTPTASSYPVSATPPASAPARWESPV